MNFPKKSTQENEFATTKPWITGKELRDLYAISTNNLSKYCYNGTISCYNEYHKKIHEASDLEEIENFFCDYTLIFYPKPVENCINIGFVLPVNYFELHDKLTKENNQKYYFSEDNIIFERIAKEDIINYLNEDSCTLLFQPVHKDKNLSIYGPTPQIHFRSTNEELVFPCRMCMLEIDRTLLQHKLKNINSDKIEFSIKQAYINIEKLGLSYSELFYKSQDITIQNIFDAIHNKIYIKPINTQDMMDDKPFFPLWTPKFEYEAEFKDIFNEMNSYRFGKHLSRICMFYNPEQMKAMEGTNIYKYLVENKIQKIRSFLHSSSIIRNFLEFNLDYRGGARQKRKILQTSKDIAKMTRLKNKLIVPSMPKSKKNLV